MQKDKKDKHFVKKPIYPGGLAAMRELIKKELTYPKEAIEHKIEGTVVLKYEINYRGKVTSSKVLSGIGYGCNEEAQRIISKFKFEVPKGPRKLKIKFGKSIKIHFRLPKEAPKKVTLKQTTPVQQSPQISYTISTPDTAKKGQSKPAEKSYSYTIKYQ